MSNSDERQAYLWDTHHKLIEYYQELCEIDVKLPDYTAKGLSDFFTLYEAVIAYAGRATTIQSDAIRLAGQSRAVIVAQRGAYQESYDDVVDTVSTLHAEKSWDERASISRTKVVDEERVLRKCEEAFILIEAYRDAIANTVRYLVSVRRDMERLFDILKMARSLKEI